MAGTGRWRSQAAQNAALKFGPQRSALRESAEEARETYRGSLGAARAAGAATQAAASQAKPQIAQIYAGSKAAQQAGTTLVSQALAALPSGAADPFKAAGATEAAQQLANLGNAESADLSRLHLQGVAAKSGVQFAQQNAQAALQKTLAGLLSKNANLSAEQGAFAATEAENLAAEAEKQEQAERASERTASTSRENSEESNRTSRENAKEAHRASGAGYVDGVKLAAPHEQHVASGEVAQMRGIASSLFGQGHDRAEVLHILATPVNAKHVDESSSHKNAKGGTESSSGGETIPGRAAFAPDALMSAALDEAQFGGITKNTLQRLHAAGYSVKALGLRVAPQRSTEVQKGLGPTIRAATKAVTGGF